MVRFSRSIEQRKQIYSCEANSLGIDIIHGTGWESNHVRFLQRTMPMRVCGYGM